MKHSPKDLPQQISKWVADNAGASDDGYDSYTVPFGDHSSLDSIEMTDVGDGVMSAVLRVGRPLLVYLDEQTCPKSVSMSQTCQ